MSNGTLRRDAILKKTIQMMVMLSAALSLAMTGAMAEIEDSPADDIKKNAVDPHRIVKFQLTHERSLTEDGNEPDPMPIPQEPEGSFRTAGKTGPVATGDSGMLGAVGAGFIGPRGAAASSSRQMAERQIKRLIRRLD
jgi:hypothetical protein